MKLLALLCVKCGAPLDFNGSLICNCGSCSTPHALVESRGLYTSVSFLPFIPRRDGKMETPLKLLLANKLRDEGFVVREGEFDMGCHTLKIEEGEVKARFYVDNSDKPLVVGEGSIVNDLVDEGLRLFRKPEPIYEARAACLDLFMIWIVPVKSDDDILIGHRVLIGVRKFQFEDRANRVSGMIRQWFDVIPEVTLLNG